MCYRKGMKSFLRLACVIVALSFATPAIAQELHQDLQETVSARVQSIRVDEDRLIPGTETKTPYQVLLVEVLEGGAKGESVQVENDYVRVGVGDKVFVHRLKTVEGDELYTFGEPNRSASLIFFTLLFLLTIIAFGGWQGMRGLVSLAGSILLILYVLLPAVLAGYSPVLVSIGAASLIIIVGSYITHGFRKSTTAAVLGMICTVIITGLLAYLSVHWGMLTGYGDESAMYLNLNAKGTIDLSGLLLGAIIIGLLGVLYDSAIGQSVAVDELHATAPHVSRREIFKRATRIGREHIGALVTALAIAYVGAALPLLLLFYQSDMPVLSLLNREVMATEIMRTLVGSIGLVLAVPITTLISIFFIVRPGSASRRPASRPDHSHGHAHHHHH
jgi:uncharacterized membrane protein